MAILIKVLFSILEFLGSSLVRLWFVLGLLPEGNREGTREGNLNKSAFALSAGVSLCDVVSPKARWWQQSCGSGSRSEQWVHKTENARRMNAEH